MTPDDIDRVNDESIRIVDAWANDWLPQLIGHLGASCVQLGKDLVPELYLPEYLTAGEEVAVKRWLAIHVLDGDADPNDDRWLAELVAAKVDDTTLLYLFGRRAGSLVSIPPQLHGWRLRTLWWAAHGWRLPHVIERLRAAGLIDRPLPSWEQVRQECGLERGRIGEGSFLEKVLARYGLGLRFDVEFSGQPVPHDELVIGFGRCSRGVFAPSNVTQTRVGSDQLLIELDHGGVRHQIQAQWLGDLYDERAVASGCNRVLAASGATGRFHRFSDGDVAEYVFGDPVLVRGLDDELCLYVQLPDTPHDAQRHAARHARLRQVLA